METRCLYDLEEKIMAAWSVVDDIKLLAETQSNRKMTQDELENFLLGMQTIYNVKFDSLFAQYEKVLKEFYHSKKQSEPNRWNLSDEVLDKYREQQCSYE